MKFKVKSCLYGFSHHTLWDSERQGWKNVGGESIEFELVPICQTEIHFDHGQVFCSPEVCLVRNWDNYERFVKFDESGKPYMSAVLYITNQEKYGDNEEWINLGSSIRFDKENKYDVEDFYNLKFFHPLIGDEFQTLKKSILNEKTPNEIHVEFERSDMKTFSYDHETKIVRWDTSIEDEHLVPGRVWFQWNRN